MLVIYNQNGTIDFLATREVLLGNPGDDGDLIEMSEEEIQETFPSDDAPPTKRYGSEEEEFWSDSCWTEPPGVLG